VTRKLYLLAVTPLLIAVAPTWKQQALHSAAPFIDKANAEWTHAIVTGDADTLSAPYDEHGIFIRPDGAEIRGKNGVHEMYAKRRDDVQILNADIKSDGSAAADRDDVYEWGTATITMKRSGKVQQATGRYLTVWHRKGETWVITHNIAF
jgi:ketosteroid isomerase-like protein